MNDTQIYATAAACHAANRVWCAASGDYSQLPWLDAPDWQRKSVVDGVKAALANGCPQKSHENWLAHKRADGWVWGEVKDQEAKTHPCMVPYKDLPPVQQAKDVIFVGVVNLFKHSFEFVGHSAAAGKNST